MKDLLSDITAKDQIELVGSGYKIKQNEVQDDNENESQDVNDENCNFVKNAKTICTSSVLVSLVANLETVIISESHKTPLPPSDLSVSSRRTIKLVYNDNTQIFIALQNMFLKEIEKMKYFARLVEREIEEINNFITSWSVSNSSIGTPKKEKESEREYPLVVELLKSTLEKKKWMRRMLLSIPSESKGSE